MSSRGASRHEVSQCEGMAGPGSAPRAGPQVFGAQAHCCGGEVGCGCGAQDGQPCSAPWSAPPPRLCPCGLCLLLSERESRVRGEQLPASCCRGRRWAAALSSPVGGTWLPQQEALWASAVLRARPGRGLSVCPGALASLAWDMSGLPPGTGPVSDPRLLEAGHQAALGTPAEQL